ncbi:MAG: type II CAAX endopeptidase family protein [bacterium]|nr:type II CAAX endopeptidase family protein [bacterium]
MDERPESNYDLEEPTLFNTGNPYFLLFFAASCLFSTFFLQQVLVIANQTRLSITLAPTAGILLPIYILTRRFPLGLRDQLRIHKPDMRVLLWVVMASLAIVIVVDYLYIFSQRVLPPPENYLEGLKNIRPTNVWTAVVTFFGLCIVVPVAEEIIIRGIVQRVFARNMGDLLAFLLAGALFGVIHLNPHLLASMVTFGIFLGFIFYATRNLTYAIVAHATLNCVAFVQLSLADEEDMEMAPFYLQEIWYLFAAAALVGILLWQIKKGSPSDDEPPEDPLNSQIQ